LGIIAIGVLAKTDNISSFEELLTDSDFKQAKRDSAYQRFIKPLWRYLIRAYITSFAWGCMLVLTWVFVEKDSPVIILVFVLGSLVLAIFGGTILYITASLVGLIPYKKYSYDQRLDFLLVVGLSISILGIIAILIFLTGSTLERIF
jgi:K+-sensing histidine kinase KdpD